MYKLKAALITSLIVLVMVLVLILFPLAALLALPYQDAF